MLNLPLLNCDNYVSMHSAIQPHQESYQMIVASEVYPHMSISLTSNLRPINGYSYGNFGVPTTFYAHVTNGNGTYTYHWFVNSRPVKMITTTNDTSSLTWNFTGPSNSSKGINSYYDYVNVTVNDTENQKASAYYRGTFWYEPEIFLVVSGNNGVKTTGEVNITITDWLDVSPLNLTVFVNGKPIYKTITPGWGGGFPITIKYNTTKTGVYNITAVAYDDSGQMITSYKNLNVISGVNFDLYVFYINLVKLFTDGTIIFISLVAFLVADLFVSKKR